MIRKYIDILNEALAEDVIDTAAPPMNDDGDAEHYDARNKTGFFGQQGAGVLMMAKTTGRVLIVLRSAQVDQPHTWGNIGGAHKADERPVAAAAREAHEETGYTGAVQMIPLYVFKKGDFRYSNFLGLVEDEFEPHLGWEADKAIWCDIGKWPTPLHFGLKALFADPSSMTTIKRYAGMFRKGDAAAPEAPVEEQKKWTAIDAQAIDEAINLDEDAAFDAAVANPEVDANGNPVDANGQPTNGAAPAPGAAPANGAPAAPAQGIPGSGGTAPAPAGAPAPTGAPAAPTGAPTGTPAPAPVNPNNRPMQGANPNMQAGAPQPVAQTTTDTQQNTDVNGQQQQQKKSLAPIQAQGSQ